VGCNKTVENDRLWREKYFPIEEQIPSFLNQKQADKVSKTWIFCPVFLSSKKLSLMSVHWH
jgi:hypothetical protein